MQVRADDRPAEDVKDKDDDLEVVVDDDTPASDAGAGAAAGDEGSDKQSSERQDGAPSSDGEDPEQEQQKRESRAQKRIRQLNQEAHEAKRMAQQAIAENQQLRQRYQQANNAAAEHFGKNLESRLAQAKDKAKRAYEEGDSDSLVQAQEELADVRAEWKNYERWKQRQQAQQQERQQAPQQQAPQQPQQNTPDQAKAQQWVAKHQWFGDTSTPQGQAMTATAYSIDAQLQQEGFDPQEDDHWQELDRRLAQAFPDRIGGQGGGQNGATAGEQTANGGRAPQQTVAGVARGQGSQQRKSNQVRLTAGEKRMADKMLNNLPKEQRYKEYARWKQRMEQEG